MSAVDRQLDELHARRASRAAERAAFEERREHGLKARHAAKLARLTITRDEEEERLEEPDNSISREPSRAPEVA